MPTQHLVEGLDPTPLDCITKSELLQMIRNAYPVSGQGWIIWADSAPDVVDTPAFAFFLWGKTVAGVPNKEIYYYNGTSWALLPYADGTLLAPGSVSINALNLTGSAAFNILQVNAAGTALAWVSVPTAIQNGTISPVKLSPVADAANYVLTSLAGVTGWSTVANLLSLMADNSVPINKLIKGAANTFLRVNAGATGLEWTTVAVSDLLAPGYVAGQSIKRNSGNTGWEGYMPVTSVALTKSFVSALLAIPVSPVFTTTPVAHGLGVVPAVLHGKLVCVGTEFGYSIGDIVDLANIIARTSDDDFHFNIVADGINIQALVPISPGTYDLYIVRKDTGAADILTPANWNIRLNCYA